MKECPRCTRPYSPLDLYCGSCGTFRCADNVPKLMQRFYIERRHNTGMFVVNDRTYSYHISNLATFRELEHAEIFRNCLVALELGKLENAS